MAPFLYNKLFSIFIHIYIYTYIYIYIYIYNSFFFFLDARHTQSHSRIVLPTILVPPGGERRGERWEPCHVVQPTRGGPPTHAGGFPATIRQWISQHSSWRCPCHGYSRGTTPRDLLDGLATLPPCILVVPCTNPEGVLTGTTALSPGEEMDAGLCPGGSLY